MPLTKATPEVIDVDKLSTNIKNNNVLDGVRLYIDYAVTTLNSTISTLDTTLTNSISSNVTSLNATISLNATTANTAVTNLESSLITYRIQDLVKRFAMPIGTCMMWPSDTIMPNLNDYGTYVALNGQFLLKVDYPELYLLLQNGTGTCIYGENATQFKVPTFSGRVPTMLGTTYDINAYTPGAFSIGYYGGEFRHTLGLPEMPNHSHVVQRENNSIADGGTDANDRTSINYTNGNDGILTSEVGGNQAHNIMQPFTVTNMIIKAKHAPSITYTP